MRKVTKILGKVLSAAVLLLIVLPLALSLLLSINAVQNFVVGRAAQFASHKLETVVRIDRVDIGIFDRITLEGLYVEDYGGDTLLYVGKLHAFITQFGIFSNGFTLRHGRLTDGKFYLRELPDGVMNVKQIVSRMGRKEKKKESDFRLSISALTVENLEFRLEKLQHRNPVYGIDFSDMDIRDIDAVIDNFTIDGGAVGAEIGRFSAREKSGFEIDDFGGKFFLANGCIGMENARLVTPHSNVSIPAVSIVGDSWAEYKEYVDRVSMTVEVRNSMLSSDDVAYFSPKLRDWRLTLRNINLLFDGVVSDFNADLKSLSFGRSSRVHARGRVTGLPKIDDTHFSLTFDDVTTEAADLGQIAANVARKELSAKMSAMMNRAGALRLTGEVEGTLASFDSKFALSAPVGSAEAELAMQPADRRRLRPVKGRIAVTGFRVGELLEQPNLGSVSCEAGLNGVVGKGLIDARVDGSVSQLEFNGYDYDSLCFGGRLTEKTFNGHVRADDPALRFDFQGEVGFNPERPHYDFDLDLIHADLARMHLNRRDSVSVLSALVEARASGRTLDDLNGKVTVGDVVYRYNADTLRTTRLTLDGQNSAGSKYLSLQSEFADATFRSRTDYKTVFEYLRSSLEKYIPLLYDERKARKRAAGAVSVVDDYSVLSVDVKHFTPVADAVADGLQIADGSQLRLLFNPANDKLSLKATSEYIERERMLATRLNLNATNRGDSLSVYLRSEDFYVGTFHMPQLSVMGGARSDRLRLSAGFNDTTARVSALLGLEALVGQSPQRGRSVDVRLLPSHISRKGTTWQIFARNIQIDTARIAVDRFLVMNRDQELLVDGVASRHRRDSVLLRLKNFDLAPFTQIVENMGYVIEGRTNGQAVVKSALGGTEITADIRMDSVEVNDIPAPPMRFTSMWDFKNDRARLTVTDREKRDTLIRGFYAPATVRYYAEARFPGIRMNLLDPMLKGVISDTRGVAEAALTLTGQRRAAQLSGAIRIRDFHTKVDYTQVGYDVSEALLTVENNRLRMQQVQVADQLGNRGIMDFDLNLQHLSNISYSLTMQPRRMLVLNTTENDNDLFYGRVFATGRATVAGDKGSVRMDIVATTDDDSAFFLPLSSKSNVARADFITFETPQQKADTLNILERKKLMFERKHKPQAIEGNSMDIDMTLNVRPNADFQLVIDPTVGDIIKGRGEGTLNLHINPRSNVFEMYGDYTITEGSYLFTLQNIINKRFIIENGSTIQWTGEPLDARLNINAVYKLKTSLQPLIGTSVSSGGGDMNLNRAVPVECIINLSDRLTHPTVTFDVKVPTADAEYQTIIANTLNTQSAIAEQFMFLLVTNSFHSDTSGGGNNLGAAASAATGFELLSNQLSNWLSTDDYNIVFRYRPKSELSGDEVDFGFSKSLINNRLFVEVEGNYMLDNSQAVNKQMSNFMGEAYVTWLIDRAGTLKLKGFTQTIDRFDENQGLQETGIGIYYKEDFNNLKDLKERLKNKFRSRRKRQQLLERRQAADSLRLVERRRAADSVRRASPADTVSSASVKKDKNLNK